MGLGRGRWGGGASAPREEPEGEPWELGEGEGVVSGCWLASPYPRTSPTGTCVPRGDTDRGAGLWAGGQEGRGVCCGCGPGSAPERRQGLPSRLGKPVLCAMWRLSPAPPPAERGHVWTHADVAAEGLGPHHRAAGRGSRWRVQGGLQGGGPGFSREEGLPGQSPGLGCPQPTPRLCPRPARCLSASSTWAIGPSLSPSRGPSPRCPSGRR